MISGQLITLGQLSEPGVNFASVHGLTPVAVHMSFSLPWGNSRGGLPVVQHRVTRLAEVTFLHVNRTQKLPQGKSSLCACSLLMFKRKFLIKVPESTKNS